MISTSNKSIKTEAQQRHKSPLEKPVYKKYIKKVFLNAERMTLHKWELLEIKIIVEHLVREQQLQRALWLAREFHLTDKISSIEKDLVKSLSESKVEDIKQFEYEPDPYYPNKKIIASGVYKLILADGSKAIFKHTTKENASSTNLNYDLAAFIIDQRLNLNIIPHTIQRSIYIPGLGQQKGNITSYIENISAGKTKLSPRINFLDFLINNIDRLGFENNTLLTQGGWQVAVDLSSAFSFNKVFSNQSESATHSRSMLNEFYNSKSSHYPGSVIMEALQNYSSRQINIDLNSLLGLSKTTLFFERKLILEEHFAGQ